MEKRSRRNKPSVIAAEPCGKRARQDDMTHKEYLCFHINYACLTQSAESKTGTALPGLLLHEIIKDDVQNNEISGPFAGDKFMNIKSIIH